MKKLYIDCSMGAAGNMLAAALLELCPDREEVLKELNQLGLEGVRFDRETRVKCGISGTYMKVLIHGQEEGEHYPDGIHRPKQEEHHHEEHHHEEHHHEEHHHEEHHHEEHHHEEHHHEEHHHEDHHHEDHPHKDHDHGTHHHGAHQHGRSMHDIEHIVNDHLNLKENVKKSVLSVYGLIAEAESWVHGVEVSQIHFHEVGNMDAIADIVSVCILMDKIGADEIIASPIHVGKGQVKCAHGILPVPAPATAYLLKGIPCYTGEIQGELCTPTGAALLKYFVKEFGNMPVMTIDHIGYGMGKKDFPAANCVRIFLGEAKEEKEQIWELSCNVDDMTGEAMGFAIERLFEAGAVDVYTIPVYMKKSRPGTLLRVMCHEEKKDRIIQMIFQNTTTIGIRESRLNRYVLERESKVVQTCYGPISCKISKGYGVLRKKYEYEELAKIAKEQGISLEELLSKVETP